MDADGSMLVMACHILKATNDRAGLTGLFNQLTDGSRLSQILFADAGHVREESAKAVQTWHQSADRPPGRAA